VRGRATTVDYLEKFSASARNVRHYSGEYFIGKKDSRGGTILVGTIRADYTNLFTDELVMQR